MRFSEKELICFNSLLEGKRIFGSNFAIKEPVSNDYIQDTIKELKDHNILNENGKPNESFAATVKLLEEYKTADTYLIINKAKIGVKKSKNYLVCLAKIENGYELTAINKQLMLYKIITASPFLTRENRCEKEINMTMTQEEWFKKVKEKPMGGMLAIQSVEGGILGMVTILYNQEDDGFIYTPINKTLIQCGSLRIRRELMRKFENLK